MINAKYRRQVEEVLTTASAPIMVQYCNKNRVIRSYETVALNNILDGSKKPDESMHT